MGIEVWLGIASSIVAIGAVAARWLWSRREREAGRAYAELERRREEDRRSRRRNELEAEIRGLDRADIVKRLRGD